MSKLVTDVTDPVAVGSIEILFKVMEHPLMLALMVVLPLLSLLYFAYRYEQKKNERKHSKI